MKIALVTDDGHTVSPHFGRATAYAVLTVEDGVIVARELRSKVAPHMTSAAVHDDELPGQPHGTGPAAQSRHDQMAAAIADCEVVICRGMGYGAYQRLSSNGIRPILADLRDIDEAALACAAGTIVDHPERLH